MKCNLIVLGQNTGEYRVVVEELRGRAFAQSSLRGFTFAQSCPSRIFFTWASVATAFRSLGIDDEYIANAKKSLDNSPDHEFIMESVNCSQDDLIAKAGFDPTIFS